MNPMQSHLARILALTLLACACPITSAADHATGTVAYKSYSSPIKYAWLVRGPGDSDPKQTLLRILFSTSDIGAKIDDCATFMCAGFTPSEGGYVEYAQGATLGYWIKVNDGHTQRSGIIHLDAFTVTEAKDHLAGKVHFDDSADQGPKIDLTFDLSVSKTFAK